MILITSIRLFFERLLFFGVVSDNFIFSQCSLENIDNNLNLCGIDEYVSKLGNE